ncbi:MAG: hypothetical protein GYA33_00470 [Thermogutta sp.]|nr:hypothetical protein [Thermogutta sp.]
MNRPEEISTQWSQELADLLVDGALPEDARREFLRRLDSIADGWRRLALTFLEAQTWRQSMGELLAPDRDARAPFPDEAAGSPRAAAGAKKFAIARPWRAGRWVFEVAALAAVFMIALALGSRLDNGRGQTGLPSVDHRADLAGNPAAAPPAPATADSPADNGPRQPVVSPWRLVSVPIGVGPDGAMTMVDLPVLDPEQPGEAATTPPGPYLPLPQFVDSLRQSGHAVEHQREYVPVDMPDGSRTLFPVDHLQIRFVGNRDYQ